MLCIDRAALDPMMPMNLQLDAQGRVLHVGPTLARTRSTAHFLGHSLFELFEFRRPKGLCDAGELRAHAGLPLRLNFRDTPRTSLRGTLQPTQEGYLLNLSFGLSFLEAIRQYQLHSSDFATTDPTIEMLYLIEAKSAAMEESRDLNMRLQGAKIAAEEQAFTDTLTGLKNRRALEHVLTRYCQQGVDFVLLGVDLDFFKTVNDSYGHAAGDHVLQHVARIMVKSTRPTDTLARIGGDEFLVVLKDLAAPAPALAVAEALIAQIEAPIAFDTHVCRISASIGITSSARYRPVNTAVMLSDVDAALYASKRLGKGRATVFETGMSAMGPGPSDRADRLDARTPPPP